RCYASRISESICNSRITAQIDNLPRRHGDNDGQLREPEFVLRVSVPQWCDKGAMSTPATINGKEVFDLLRDDLAAIEREFGRDTVAGVEAITEIGEYLRGGGGKRIRPALLLLSSKLFNYQGRGAIRLGAVVEIIHTATLVHDDIIDEAQIRRGRPAANTQWGNSKCVLAGDWLYMQAFKIAVQERNFRVLDVLIELTQQMVEGELLQMEKLGKLMTLAEHFDLMYRKTAGLFSVCMR